MENDIKDIPISKTDCGNSSFRDSAFLAILSLAFCADMRSENPDKVEQANVNDIKL